MPLPAASCAADVPDDVCCDTFWLIGERIRTIAFAAVSACLDDECRLHRTFRTYQTSGPRVLDVDGESLIVSFVNAGDRPGSTDRAGATRAVQPSRALYLVELREGPWPMIREHSSTQTVKKPDWEMVHAVNQHAVGHAEKMWRVLRNAAGTTIPDQRMFSPSLHPHVLDKGVAVSQLTPRGPSGAQVSFQVTVTVDTTLR